MNAAAFADAIARILGAAPPASKIVPGKIVRFSTNGKRGDSAGWCKLFEDGRGGVFGDWRHSDEVHTWRDSSEPMTGKEARRHRKEIAAAQAARLAEEAQRHARAAEDARRIWSAARDCEQHPYTTRKHVSPDNLRVQFSHARECRDQFFTTFADGECVALRGLLLLIPLRSMDWRLWSLQAIDTEGRKAFLRGGRKRGLFHLVGRHLLQGATAEFSGRIGVAEGLATAKSVYLSADWPVFTAFDAGNLLPVAQQVRARFPKADVIVCGDVDASGVGQEKAIAASAAIAGSYALPPLTEDQRRRGLTDWNDLMCDTERRQILAGWLEHLKLADAADGDRE